MVKPNIGTSWGPAPLFQEILIHIHANLLSITPNLSFDYKHFHTYIFVFITRFSNGTKNASMVGRTPNTGAV
jgi:hypothetical protein